MTTNINKNIADIKSLTAKKISDIKTDEMTLNETIKNMSASGSYMVNISNHIKLNKKMSLSAIADAMTLNKEIVTRAKKSPCVFKRFGVDDDQKMAGRFLFWATNNTQNRDRFLKETTNDKIKVGDETDADKIIITRLK